MRFDPYASTVLLLFAVLATLSVQHASGSVHLVVDVDGALEDFAALTTILRHSSARGQLALVTINGNGWGSLKTTEANVKRFLRLSGTLDDVAVALGSVRTLADAYNGTTYRADCLGSQGIPKTPYEATRRGMRVSRYDVDRCFGACTTLLPTLPAATLATSLDATTALLNLLQGLTTGERIQFLSLKSLTTFAKFLQKAREVGLLPKFIASVELHTFENGGNWALDAVATGVVLRQPSLAVFMYTPQLWQTSVTFSLLRWSVFEKAATSAGTSDEVRWLYSAWKAMKRHFDGDSNTATRFFQERGPASSLIALCVVDVVTQAVCSKYRSANTSAMLSLRNTTASVPVVPTAPYFVDTVTIAYDLLGGLNITQQMFLQYPATTTTSSGAAQLLVDGAWNVYVTDAPASTQWPGSEQLVDVFWRQWTALLSQ